MYITLYTRTAAEIKKAERIQSKLHNRYNTVTVTPHGIDQVMIIAINN